MRKKNFRLKLKHLWMEVTNRCNGNCIFCGREYALPACDMELGFFKNIVDQCKEAKIVQTQGFGEPLLYPHIVEAVEYATNQKREVVFYTNGSLLDEKMARALLETNFARIIFSVDDMTKEKYEYFRPPLKWDTLLENIKRFQKMRDEGGYITNTSVRMCITPENREYVHKIKAFWSERVDQVAAAPEVDIPAPTELRKTPYVNGSPITDCPFPYNYLSVKSNGDVVICCRDWFNVYVLGNLHVSSVEDIYYKGLKNRNVRLSHKSGRNIPYLCQICKTRRMHGRHRQ